MGSCQTQKQWNRKGEKNNWFSSNKDTTIKGETKQGETIIVLDSNKLDSIAQVIAEEYQRLLDSCSNKKDSVGAKNAHTQKRKEEIKKLITQIPCNIEPINDSTDRFSLRVWSDSGRLKYDLKIKDIDVELKCPECLECKKNHWTILEIIGLVFICFVGGVIATLIFKR